MFVQITTHCQVMDTERFVVSLHRVIVFGCILSVGHIESAAYVAGDATLKAFHRPVLGLAPYEWGPAYWSTRLKSRR